ALAPWIALRRRAALLLTSKAGDNVAAVVTAALKNPDVSQADHLILAGDLEAIPPERRPNPLEGKDAFVETDPLTPKGDQPVSFASGRLFHRDRAVVALVLARRDLLKAGKASPRALLVSNPGGSLPLLETISRNTALELRNAGYHVDALFEG